MGWVRLLFEEKVEVWNQLLREKGVKESKFQTQQDPPSSATQL